MAARECLPSFSPRLRHRGGVQAVRTPLPILLLVLLAVPCPALGLQAPGRVVAARLPPGQAAGPDFADLARTLESRNPGYSVAWEPAVRELPPAAAARVALVQGGASSEPALGTGDLVLLRPGEGFQAGAPLDLLVFTLPEDLPPGLPAVIRPDFDPRITDTPGGCATEAGAYQRVLLTWEGRNGPYLCHSLNVHRVRIRDSFTHYHPREGGFDELYLVQDALPGAVVLVCEDLETLLAPPPPGLDAATARGLLRAIPVRAGDLLFLPRGVAHRGLGGVLAQVVTIPGFVPGAEIPVDDAIGNLALRFGLKLPWHEPSRPFVAVYEKEERVRVEVDGALFTEYHCRDLPRSFFFPVLGPDGRAMTRGFPLAPGEGEARDHPHHTSLWFAHGDVDGVDFWHDRAVRMRLVALEGLRSRPGEAGFTARHNWIAPGGRLVLHDRRVFRFGAATGRRWVDWDITLTAPGDRPVRFGDTKEGSMAMRLAATLRAEGPHATCTLVDSAGRSGRAVWGRRADWIATWGLVDGRPAGVAILEHPTSFRHPTRWHARTYGLLAANPFGSRAFGADGSGEYELPPGESLHLRYRFVLLDHQPSPRELHELAAAWAASD